MNGGSSDSPGGSSDRVARPGHRAAILEAVVVGGAALFAIFVLIPRQTTPSPDAAGLEPATLPTVCAVIIAVLSVFRLLASLASTRRASRRGTASPVAVADTLDSAIAADRDVADTVAVRIGPFPAVVVIIAVALAGLIGLMTFGPVACAAIIVLAGMPALGERRWLRILLCTVGAIAAALPLQ